MVLLTCIIPWHSMAVNGPHTHMEDTHGGHTWRAHMEGTHGGHTWRAHMEGTHGGHTWRTHMEGTHGGHTWRTHMEDTIYASSLVGWGWQV